MNAAPRQAHQWSYVRWLGIVAVIFLGQLAVIWALGQRELPSQSVAPFTTRIAFANEPTTNSEGGNANPALFALPDAEGFSGSAWLRYDALRHQFIPWHEPPQWLALSNNPVELGKMFSRFVAENQPAPLRVIDLPLPRNPASEPPPPDLPMADRSVLRVEEPLALTGSMTMPDLPSWQHTEPLSNSVVQVVVDGDGIPFSCVLMGSCGRKDADQQALKIARTLRFRPRSLLERYGRNRPEAVSIGKLIFQWHTQPLTDTPRSVSKAP